MYELKSIRNEGFRPSVYVGEVAYLTVRGHCTEDREWIPYPAPLGAQALTENLTKEEARQALSQVAEVALDMAESIDKWWEEY